MKTVFSVEEIGQRIYAVNDRGRTVATVSSHGDIDWRLRSPLEDGPRLDSVPKETHLGYVIGLKLTLNTPWPATQLKSCSWRFEQDRSRIILVAHSESVDGTWQAGTLAALGVDDQTGEYRWDLESELAYLADEPAEVGTIEYNNVLPAGTGQCFLFAPEKKFRTTLMTDRQGTVWAFPHQHMMHYSFKIDALDFSHGTMAGFFGEPGGCPVAVLKEGTGKPHWAICDMYYDLHCQARIDRTVQPNEKLRYRYEVKYLDAAEAERLVADSRTIPVSEEDRNKYYFPRIELGLNQFNRACVIDRFDDASGFRPDPPRLVWDRKVGNSAPGSLRIVNDAARETAWRCEPPTLIPNERELSVRALIKTDAVAGKGAFVRIKYYSFSFWPEPGITYKSILETEAVQGTSEGWVEVAMPVLRVPEEDFDFLIDFEVVLDGEGAAWFTEMEIRLEPLLESAAIAEG